MVKSIFSCFAVLLCTNIASALAQVAPPRFTQFVFPHGTKQIYPYGDTIILEGKEDFEVTTDGGKTWDLFARDSSIKISAHPNHPILYYSDIRNEDSIWSFYISKDLGRSFERRSIGKDTVGYWRSLGGNLGGGLGGVRFSPWNPEILYVTANTPGIVSFMKLIRSRDGGLTWFYQDTPRPTDGSAGLEYDISFNRRNPSRWHVLIKGTYHPFEEDYYYTDDDGDSFIRVSNWSVYAGISNEDDVLDWNLPGAGREKYRGPYASDIYHDRNMFSSSWSQLDWFANAGLKNYEYSDTLLFGFKPGSYYPWYPDPSVGVIRLDSTLKPTFKRKSSAVYLIRGAGESLELLWYDTASIDAFLDSRNMKVWVYHTPKDGDGSSTLWYTSFPKSEVATGAPGLGSTELYPNPATDRATLLVGSESTGYIELFDILGRVHYSQKFDSSSPSIALLLGDVPVGAYRLIVHTDGIIRQLSLNIVR